VWNLIGLWHMKENRLWVFREWGAEGSVCPRKEEVTGGWRMRSFINCKNKGKGKNHLHDCFCIHRSEAKYNSNPFATSALEGVRCWTSRRNRFAVGEYTVPNCAGGLMGLGAALDGDGKSRFRWDSIPVKSSHRFECAVGGVRHPQHTQTSSNSSTIAADSSDGVTNTRCCRYSCTHSWWWVEVPPETCRAVSRYK
jgi:hypothetical protein